MKREYSAFDAYGGSKAVFERMELLARDKLSSMPDKCKAHMYKELREEKNTNKIIEFLDGKRSINFKIFETLRNSYLEMNIDDFLGESDLSTPEVRRYWENQMMVNPIAITLGKPKSRSRLAEVRLYIEKAIINELAHAA